jgi:hypothetical protein
MARLTDQGTRHHIDRDPYGERDFGSRPSVGQSKSYQSGSNARGQHQRATRGPEAGGSSGVTRSDGPERAGTGTSRDLRGGPRRP